MKTINTEILDFAKNLIPAVNGNEQAQKDLIDDLAYAACEASVDNWCRSDYASMYQAIVVGHDSIGDALYNIGNGFNELLELVENQFDDWDHFADIVLFPLMQDFAWFCNTWQEAAIEIDNESGE